MRIAISTGGGDAPGLNAVIHAATMSAIHYGHEMVGIRNGFEGLQKDGELIPLDAHVVEGIERTGGTILGAASSGVPYRDEDEFQQLIENFHRQRIDALIMCGGEGTALIAHKVSEAGIKVILCPKTIDRDVYGTWTTYGFDTAISTATENIDRLHSTAKSHQRLMVVEVMGRDTGWIALYSGIAGGAHMISIPELPYDIRKFAEHIRRREEAGEQYHIMVVAEGARPVGGEVLKSERTGRYGGVAEVLAAELADLTGKDARSLSLGHLLRGGAPTTFDRVLALRFGSAAVAALHRGESDVMIAFNPPGFTTIPLTEIAGKTSFVTPDAHEVRTAQNMEICFG